MNKENLKVSEPMAENPLLPAVFSSGKKPRCHNCKHGSSQFKIANLTHLQCCHPKHEQGFKDGTLSPWDTLQIFSNTCETHEFRVSNGR